MKTKIRILHIDDNLHDRQIVKEVLQQEPDEFEIIETDGLPEFEQHLSKSDFDLILSEINLPGLDGLKVLQIVKKKRNEIPVIILTGKGSEEIAVEAMKLGAADYVIKSKKHIQNLTPTIRKVIENRKIQGEHNATRLALHKSEERFRLLFNNSIDAVLLTMPDGAILEANTTACNIFGRTEEELKQFGRNGIMDVTDPRLAIAIEECSRTGKYKGELTGLRKDGTPFPIEISSVLFQDNDGNLRSSMIIRDTTEPKLTEKLIQESNSRFELAMQAANMAWWEMDMVTGKVIFEKRKVDMLGYTHDKFKHYKDFMALVHPDDYDKTMNAMQGHIDGILDRYEIEYRILTQSGEYKWFYDVGSITKKDSKGTPQSIAGIVIDISSRKESDDLLVASETRYRRLFESAKDGILILDAETGMIADVNPFLVKLLGYSTEQFHGKKIWEIGIFSDIIANQSKFLELQQNEYVRYEDLPLKTSDGREIAVEFVSNVYLVNSHKVIQCNIRDITERKRGEEKEKEMEAKYTKLYGSIRDAILVADNDRKIIDCNPAFTEMFGYSLNDIKNKNTLTIYENKKHFNEVGQALKNHATEKSPFLYTINYKKKNGEVFPGETSVYYLRNLNGDFTGFIGLIRDITERKHLEQEKEILTYNLNERVKELTCLYAISSISETADISLDVILNQAVKVIPSGWQYPDICGAKIIIDDDEYQTTNYRQTEWKMSVDIKNIGKKSGTVEISYLEEKEEIDEGPFVKEERDLLNLIAERIGHIVERKQAEEMLRKSENEFRILAESMPQIVWITKADGSNIYFNQKWVDYTGLTLEESYGHGWNKPFHPDDQQMAWEAWQNATKTNGIYSIESRICSANGTYKWFLVRGVPLLDTQGNILKWFGTCTDINEIKQAEEELIKSEEKYRSIFENIQDVYFEILLDGTIIEISSSIETVLKGQYHREELIGKSIRDALYSKSDFDSVLLEIQKTGTIADYEVQAKNRDGSIINSSISAKIHYNTEGQIEKVIGSIHDITNRKQAEEAIKATEMRYRRLFESAQDGILILDAESGMIVDVNPFLVELLGYSTEQFHGKKIWEIGIFSDLIANQEKFLELQQNEYVRYDDLPLKTSDGRQIAVEFVSNVYEVNQQKVIQCNIRNITERKRIEEEIRSIAKFPSENPSPILRIDNDGTLLYVNEFGMKQLHEWKLQIGQSANDMLKDVVFKTLNNGETQEVEFEHKDKVFLFKVVPFVNEGYANLYGEDITERKRAEETLRLSEAKFKVIFDNASDGIFLVDLKSKKFFMCNETCARMLNHTKEEFPNLEFADIHPWEDLPFIYEQIGKFSRGEERISNDIRFKRKNGDIFFADLSPTLITIDDKKFMLILFKDITERKKAEEQRIIQTTALEATAISVVITDAEGTITWVNNAFTLMTGYSKEEAIGKTPSILNSGKHDKSFFKNMWDTIKAGHVWYGEVFNRRKDGSLLTDEMTITPVLDKDGIVRNFIALKQDITERKRVRETLIESENLLSSTQKFAHIGSFNYFLNSNELKWSDELYNILGLQRDTFKVSAESFINCIYPDDRNSMVNWIEQTSSGINTEDLDFRIVKPDGTIRNIYGSGKLQSDSDGKAQRIIGSAQDITERKNTEKSLKKSEEKFRSLLENSADAIFIADPMGKYIYTNKAVTDLLGYSSKEMLLKTIADLAPKDKIDEPFEIFTEIMSKGKVFAEIDLLKKDGNFISTDLNAVLLPDGSVYGSCRDITESKKAKEEIRNLNANLELKVEERTVQLVETNKNLHKEIKERTQAEERIHLIYNASPYSIILVDSKGTIHLTNNTTEDYFGYDKNQLIGTNIDLLVPKGKDIHHSAHMENFFTNATKRQMGGGRDLFALKKGGSIFPVEIGLTPINIDGEIMTLTNIIDITERKQAENKIRQAKAQAEQANKAKSQFLANMSHEIRTPMNAVLGYSELLGSMVENKIQKDYIESIKSSGRSLLTLINDILDLSKIEADKMELEFDYIKTSSFFSEFERIFSLKISEKGLEFMLDIDSETPAGIYIDEARLRQILLNLIGNAVKFTKKGHIKLKVYTENPQILNHTDGKSKELIDLVIEIEDTGIGISKEFQEKIFEPFTQQSGQQKYGGTGLGLAISQRLVKLMNGTIALQSELRKGSAFRIIFHEIKYLRNFENEKNEIQINTANIEFEKATILVVDDVKDNRKYLADALKNKNITVLEAENGLLAYKLAKEKIPNLIISDIGMPKLDGFGLLNKVKTDKTLKHIPVIAYSASVMKGQKEKINKSEFAGLLTKPVQVSELYIELLNYLPYKQNKTEIPETAGKIEFKELSIPELTIPEFAKDFNSQVLPIWKSVKERRSQKLVSDLSTKMQELGEKYNSKNSTEFGSMLKIANDSFNVEEVRSLLKRFEIFENNFKKHKNK